MPGTLSTLRPPTHAAAIAAQAAVADITPVVATEECCDESAVPGNWDEKMNSFTLCGESHMEQDFCPKCRDINADMSLIAMQDREFKQMLRDAYDASLTGPEGNDHSVRKHQGVRARVAKERKNRDNAKRRDTKNLRHKDPSLPNPKARHHMRANARHRYGPLNHQAQRQRDVHDEQFALVDGHLAEEYDWFTPLDLADLMRLAMEEDEDKDLPIFGVYVPLAEAGEHPFGSAPCRCVRRVGSIA